MIETLTRNSVIKGYLLILSLTLLAGCASMGFEKPESLSDRIAYAEGDNTALREAATSSLDARQISSADMQFIIDLNARVKALLASARLLMNTDPSTAEGRLLAATKILTEAQTYLRRRGVNGVLEEGYKWVT